MVAVDLRDLEIAVEYVSADVGFEHRAYLSLDTGTIFWLDGEEQDIPEDLETSDRYIEIPSKRDLDLGGDLVRDFVARSMPQHAEEVRRIFSRKGAYRRFKDFLDDRGLLAQWYDFEAHQEREALREWCEAQGIEIVERP